MLLLNIEDDFFCGDKKGTQIFSSEFCLPMH